MGDDEEEEEEEGEYYARGGVGVGSGGGGSDESREGAQCWEGDEGRNGGAKMGMGGIAGRLMMLDSRPPMRTSHIRGRSVGERQSPLPPCCFFLGAHRLGRKCHLDVTMIRGVQTTATQGHVGVTGQKHSWCPPHPCRD